MRAVVNALAIVAFGFALGAVTSVAIAEERERDSASSRGSGQDGADRWVPSIALSSGFTAQSWEGSVESESCPNCSFSDPAAMTEPLRDPASGSDTAVTPNFGANLELMSPEYPIWKLSPRLFVGGEAFASFGVDRSVALEGDPGELESPLPEGASNTPYSEDNVLGQGSKTQAKMNAGTYGAYAGVAIPFELYGRPVRLKTAVAWMRYSVSVEGLVVKAECRQFLNNTNCNPDAFGGAQRDVRLESSTKLDFDGIGPSIDLEMDTGRFGQLGTSLFLGARFYNVLGDRSVELSDTQVFTTNDGPGLPPGEAQARFGFEVDEWIYRMSLGIRFHWLGSRD